MDKTVKNMKTMKAKPNYERVPQVSVSDVGVSVRSDTSDTVEDFTATMIDFQKKVADESFNVMQIVVRTMTGLFPKVGQFYWMFANTNAREAVLAIWGYQDTKYINVWFLVLL